MSNVELGGWSLAVLLGLLTLRVPIGGAMLLVGLIGYFLLFGWDVVLNFMNGTATSTLSVYELSIIPMFVLMGQFASLGGMSTSLFGAANAFFGRRRGGVAVAAIGACAGFGAICGSSLATAATMGRVALPELERFRYSPTVSTGALAAGGTLGILIPPSIPLVIYAILTEQNIAKLFLAAVVPGIMAMVGYMVVAAWYAQLYPELAPRGEHFTTRQKLAALLAAWPIVAVFVAVIGGIYSGVFTPTEAAAIGAVGTGLIAFANGALSRSIVVDAFLRTAETSGMIFFIILGGAVFSAFLAASGFPAVLASWLVQSGLEPLALLVLILAVYIVLGCLMDSMSMIVLTIPIFFPVIMQLDLYGLTSTEKALWFGILTLVVIEVGQITPPVGMNVYIIKNAAPHVPILKIFKGAGMFLISDAVRLVLLLAFPIITLALVS